MTSSPNPDLAAVLEAEPVGVIETDWGAMPLRVSAYTTTPLLPLELVTSVRCIVQVGQQVVLCQNGDGVEHPWPGVGVNQVSRLPTPPRVKCMKRPGG